MGHFPEEWASRHIDALEGYALLETLKRGQQDPLPSIQEGEREKQYDARDRLSAVLATG